MKNNFNKYQISPENEKAIWNDCHFVFDSSSLLNFYEYSVETRKNIFDSTFKVIKERLWIPQHVEFEFLKNKECTFKKPISKYNFLISEHLLKIEEQFKQLKNKTKKSNKHPYISESLFLPLDKELAIFKEKLTEEIKERINEIENLNEKDDVSIAFDKYFKVGGNFNYQELTEIAKEGEFRYKFSIPPGYKDLNEKQGFQIFGDLIIWKQIIEYAKAINKPIVFITDDVKEDWWVLRQKGDTERPREELIDEIDFHANVPFWMYTTIQFLEKSKEFLDTKIKENSIMEVRYATRYFYGFQVEEAFTKWAIREFSNKGEIIYPENHDDLGVDLILKGEKEVIGFEVKFFPNRFNHHVRLRLRRTLENMRSRKVFENFDKVCVVVIMENEDSAIMAKKEIECEDDQLFLFDNEKFDFEYIFGYMDDFEFNNL